jgi:hypothetical protein
MHPFATPQEIDTSDKTVFPGMETPQTKPIAKKKSDSKSPPKKKSSKTKQPKPSESPSKVTSSQSGEWKPGSSGMSFADKREHQRNLAMVELHHVQATPTHGHQAGEKHGFPSQQYNRSTL